MAAMVDLSVYADAHLRNGIAHLLRNEFAAAVTEFDNALSLSPNDPYAHWNKATALLSLGDYANGFVEHQRGLLLFDCRGFGPVGNDIERLRTLPLWNGEPGQRLLVYHELGYGDAIMCFRYLRTLAQIAASVTLVVDASLARLAVPFEVEVATAVPPDLTAFDVRLPLFGVMAALRATVETIPPAPYIAAQWQWSRPGNNVGIAWSGRTQRAFAAQRFIAAFGHCGMLYSLQPGEVPDSIIPLAAVDFADTAELIEAMDHIVTVDTAVAHLAGAMGHPSVHLLLPWMCDWRWWHVGAWYPTIRTYRQSDNGDWPFAQIARAIRDET